MRYEFLPSENPETFVICSNICHPTQVNDSLTGVAVGADIITRLSKLNKRKYSYLFLVIPEKIGSVAFLSHHPDFIQKSIGRFFPEMLGTYGPLVGQKTRAGDTYTDTLMESHLSLSKI